MGDVKIKRVYRRFTKDERERHRRIREQVARDTPRLNRETFPIKAEMDVAFAAMQVLKRERERRSISLNRLAERTGIAKGNLSKLENDRNANPTLETIMRIARAIGGTLEFTFRPAA